MTLVSQCAIQSDNQVLNNALELIAQGILCFPCTQDKKPACPNGFKAATKDAIELQKLWLNYPGKLIGIPTGAISGFDVLDIDPRHGGDKWLEQNLNAIPPTRIHETRSGGKHFLFHHHQGLRNSASKISAGVDVRADGGYIIWWPAENIAVLQEGPVAPWPPWILNFISPSLIPSCSRVDACFESKEDSYISAALRNAANQVANAPAGCRNETLNKEAFILLRFVEQGHLDALIICRVLAEAALSAGLGDHEIAATLASALRARGIA